MKSLKSGSGKATGFQIDEHKEHLALSLEKSKTQIGESFGK